MSLEPKDLKPVCELMPLLYDSEQERRSSVCCSSNSREPPGRDETFMLNWRAKFIPGLRRPDHGWKLRLPMDLL